MPDREWQTIVVFQRNTSWVEKSFVDERRSVGTHGANIEKWIARNVPMER